jgi:hypothetical protein
MLKNSQVSVDPAFLSKRSRYQTQIFRQTDLVRRLYCKIAIGNQGTCGQGNTKNTRLAPRNCRQELLSLAQHRVTNQVMMIVEDAKITVRKIYSRTQQIFSPEAVSAAVAATRYGPG